MAREKMLNLRFNNAIYRKQAIQEAISAYSHIARFSMRNNNIYTKVTIDRIDHSFKNVIVDEFANYVLGATKKCL